MIQTLARKRTQLGAMAVLAGLVVALFAVFQSVQAAPAVKITINDSDNVVKAGAGYEIQIRVNDPALAANARDVSTAYVLEYLTVSNGVFLANIDSAVALEAATGDTDPDATLVVPPGAAGVYTITAGVLDENGGPGGTALRLVGSLDVTVGDVGTPIGSAEVTLATVIPAGSTGAGEINAGHANAVANPVTDSGTKRMGSNIAVTVNVLNSLGNKPNDSEVTQVLLFAPAAQAVAASDAGANPGSPTDNSASAGATPLATEHFFVTRATSGTVDVYAVAIGTGGTATSSAITLTFTGDADTIALGDPSSPLATTSTLAGDGPDNTADTDDDIEASGHATVKITAVDAAGNKAGLDVDSTATPPAVSGLSFAFKDADGEAVVGKFNTAQAQAPKAGDTTCNDSATPADNTCDGTTVILTITTVDAAPGTYTMEATFGQKEAVTAEIVVSGPPAAIELSSSHDTVQLGNIVTITATVTDKDGHAVTNENSVTFVAVGSLELTALDSLNPNTKHGEAKIRYVVTKGSGTATIIASDAAENGTADAVIAVSMGVAEDAAPQEVGLDCLGSLNGFSTYTCSMGSTAAELFGLVSSRGATAIHLWNGSMWVRYAVVDGAEIPGSSDFSVAEDDILYISN